MTDMQLYGLMMLLCGALVVLSFVLRGRSRFVWAVALTLVGFAFAILALTPTPATIASAILGTGSVKVVPAPAN